jgi:hypothetical protein
MYCTLTWTERLIRSHAFSKARLSVSNSCDPSAGGWTFSSRVHSFHIWRPSNCVRQFQPLIADIRIFPVLLRTPFLDRGVLQKEHQRDLSTYFLGIIRLQAAGCLKHHPAVIYASAGSRQCWAGPFVLRRQSVAAPPVGNRCISSASEQSMPVASRARCEEADALRKASEDGESKIASKISRKQLKSTPVPRTRAAILSVIIFAISPLVMVRGYGRPGKAN